LHNFHVGDRLKSKRTNGLWTVLERDPNRPDYVRATSDEASSTIGIWVRVADYELVATTVPIPEERGIKIGDKVRVIESRPLSKEKCWRLVEVLERAK